MGRAKLLLPFAGTTLLRRVVERVARARIDDLLVVLGADAPALRAELVDLPCRVAQNPDFGSGMGTSFRAAVEALAPDVTGALFALADQPFVTTAMCDALLKAYREMRPLAALARFGGIVAPPHVVDRELFPALGNTKSGGVKALLYEHWDRCVVLDFPEEGLLDVDDPESYARALAHARNSADGTDSEPR
ncbi:MAG: nucleotidyltransferase family protein [Candidatus Eremiobacteraeota bacterium]|nr:nucleotidyltransferase family protein [Candidatus Eremiobacteraeota bacterium]MBV9648234.1 nucleotidyltransferase family protein [Candidatus Eremiobacteraeota bacterium]